MTAAPDIFLSYNREDQAVAKCFAAAFKAAGLSVWWDVTLRSGETYDRVTEEALRTAKAVVVLWSPRSVDSRWVRAEASIADENGTLVPATIEVCQLPVMFRLTQTADLSIWRGETDDPVWMAFLSDVRRLVEAEADSTPALPHRVRSAGSAPLHRSNRPSIAVLPFLNRSAAVEDNLFAEGLVEDLTAVLSFNPRLKVVARSPSPANRSGERDLRQIGRDLGVRYLLDGNVRRLGGMLRITAQLIDAADGDILWTQRFDRSLSDLPDLQDELAAEVAAHFGVQAERFEMERAVKRSPNDTALETRMRAYSAALYSTTQSGYEAAVAESKRLVELEPDDGTAHGALAAFQGQLLLHRGGGDPGLEEEIASNIARARALGPNDPRVLALVAGALLGLGKSDDALPLAERAVAISPNQDTARMVLGWVLARLGRSDEAIAQLDTVERLAPNSYWSPIVFRWRSIALLQKGELEPALAAADCAVRLVPGPESLIQQMLCLTMLNNWDQARDVMAHLRKTSLEMSFAFAEHHVRILHSGSNAVEEYVAIIRKLWDKTQSTNNAL
jgi:TolB-like protein/Flp pilus assembly protein TadD